MKLYSALISMDVTTAPKLFWRRGKVFVDGFRMCALQVKYMELNCVQTIWVKIEVLLRSSWGIWGTHWDKGMWKNINSTFITLQVKASCGGWEVSFVYRHVLSPDTDLHIVSGLIYAPVSKDPTHHQAGMI
jgi:hypothetical protein